MPRLKFFHLFLSIGSLSIVLLLNLVPSVATPIDSPYSSSNRYAAPRFNPPLVRSWSLPTVSFSPSSRPYSSPLDSSPSSLGKIPGTAGCFITRSDGLTLNLDRICGQKNTTEKTGLPIDTFRTFRIPR